MIWIKILISQFSYFLAFYFFWTKYKNTKGLVFSISISWSHSFQSFDTHQSTRPLWSSGESRGGGGYDQKFIHWSESFCGVSSTSLSLSSLRKEYLKGFRSQQCLQVQIGWACCRGGDSTTMGIRIRWCCVVVKPRSVGMLWCCEAQIR